MMTGQKGTTMKVKVTTYEDIQRYLAEANANLEPPFSVRPENLSCPGKCLGCPLIHCDGNKFYNSPRLKPTINPSAVKTYYVYFSDGRTPYNSCIEVEASSPEMAEVIARIDPQLIGDKYDGLVEFFVEDHYDIEYCMP